MFDSIRFGFILGVELFSSRLVWISILWGQFDGQSWLRMLEMSASQSELFEARANENPRLGRRKSPLDRRVISQANSNSQWQQQHSIGSNWIESNRIGFNWIGFNRIERAFERRFGANLGRWKRHLARPICSSLLGRAEANARRTGDQSRPLTKRASNCGPQLLN